MFKTFKVIFAAAVLAMGLSSCIGGDDDTTRSETIMNCFAYVENLADREPSGFTGLSYEIKLNYTKGTADVTINDMKLPDGKSYSSVKLSDMKFSINKEGWIDFRHRPSRLRLLTQPYSCRRSISASATV